jgi:hypothetical protein
MDSSRSKFRHYRITLGTFTLTFDVVMDPAEKNGELVARTIERAGAILKKDGFVLRAHSKKPSMTYKYLDEEGVIEDDRADS